MHKLSHLVLVFMFAIQGFSQSGQVEWRVLPVERLPPDRRPLFYQMLCSPSGSLILSSTHGLIDFQGFRINFPSVSIIAKEKEKLEKIKDPHTDDGIRAICRGAGSNFFFLTSGGRIYYLDEKLLTLTGWSNPPLYIPVDVSNEKTISTIWADDDGDLFVGVQNDSLIIFQGMAKHSPSDGEMDSEGNFISKEATRRTRKIFINGNPNMYVFTSDARKGHVLLATSKGLIRINKENSQTDFLGKNWNTDVKVTSISPGAGGNVWFGTVGHGMGLYNAALNEYFFYTGNNQELTINSFCWKSDKELFVAIADSLPAVFNTADQKFNFLFDTIFNRSRNQTTDIKVNAFGNLFVIKGGALFYSNSFSESKAHAGIKLDSAALAPFIWDIEVNGRPYYDVVKVQERLPSLEKIKLKHNQNRLEFSYSLLEFWNQSMTATEWKLDGLNMDWVPPIPDPEKKFKVKFIPPLSPGTYVFRVRAKVGNEAWRKHEASLTIVVSPALWQTWWFWAITAFIVIGTVFFFYKRHISMVRKKERDRMTHEKDLLELEAKALRAQMNPHFVFNSLNSIKSLINKNENEKAAGYLATFSKLIRTLFQNSDKREVSLYEEIETCKLYTQLEKMRFGDKVEFVFDIDESIDLKSFKVPSLILQPFIENAIWHGLMPRESGGEVRISVKKANGAVQCIIDDNGIGRELSMQNKPQYQTGHQSKGISLTHSRLELDKLLNEREDSILINDKKDAGGKATGTTVTLTFNEN